MTGNPSFQRFVSLTERDVPMLLARMSKDDLGIDGERYGVVSRLIARPNATVPDLAVALINKLCLVHSIARADLGGIVLSSRSFEVEEHLAETMRRLEVSCEASAIERACSGFPAATELAVEMSTRLEERVALLTPEIISRNINWEPPNDTPADQHRARAQASKLFADGAAAVLVHPPGETSGHEILDAWHGEVRDEHALIQKSEVPEALDPWGEVQAGTTTCISMPGRRGWQLMRTAPELMTQAAHKSLTNALRRGDIEGEPLAGVVHHQANGLMVPRIEKHLAETDWGQNAKVWNCIATHGNTVSATIPLAMADVQDKLEPGSLVAMPSVGAGGPGYRPDVLSTGCVLIRVGRPETAGQA